MRSFDLSPLYRNSIGYDRLASLLENAFRAEQSTPNYPPYDIEAIDENNYAITLAVAGFSEDDLEIVTERGVLSIRGQHQKEANERNFLHRGIATRAFERKFNLAEHVKICHAHLNNGLLTITLKREIPETLMPKKISISKGNQSDIQSTQRQDQAA